MSNDVPTTIFQQVIVNGTIICSYILCEAVLFPNKNAFTFDVLSIPVCHDIVVIAIFVHGVDQKFTVVVPLLYGHEDPVAHCGQVEYTKSTTFHDVTVEVKVICEVHVSV